MRLTARERDPGMDAACVTAESDPKQYMSTYVTAPLNRPEIRVQRASVMVKQGDISSLLIKSRRPSIVRLSPRRSAQKWPEIRKDIP